MDFQSQEFILKCPICDPGKILINSCMFENHAVAMCVNRHIIYSHARLDRVSPHFHNL
jgi:hypothetical protein